ncbi:MAG: SPFH domain-containing protein [Verrucomicrobiae bacterium]|nr:SPFH domain-containing protein [Verrucomicrobiae bacterium]
MELVIIGFIALPILVVAFVISGLFIVKAREEFVVLFFGKFSRTITSPGIRWYPIIGRELRKISTRDTTTEIKTSTVVDRNGNPVTISAVIVYRVVDSKKAAIDVHDHHKFISDQASAVVKGICSKLPYESQEPNEPCLKEESEEVTLALIQELQKSVDAAGISVLSVRFNDLCYAPEIAQAMLMRQQAMAFIEARRLIVEGAVELAHDAITRLEAKDIQLSKGRQEDLISNLLVVLCSGESAQPVVKVDSER